MTVSRVSVASPVRAAVSPWKGKVQGGWSFGSGVPPQPGRPTPRAGLWANVMANPLSKISGKASVDAKKKTVTITLGEKAGRPNHMADKQFHLAVPRALNVPERVEIVSYEPALVRVSIPGQ